MFPAFLPSAKATALRSMMNARFLDNSTGVYGNSSARPQPESAATQCGQSLPLWLGLVPSDLEAKVVQVLVDALQRQGNHLQVGGFGIKWLLMSLSAHQQQDLAYTLMTQEDYPSFGYM